MFKFSGTPVEFDCTHICKKKKKIWWAAGIFGRYEYYTIKPMAQFNTEEKIHNKPKLLT